MSDQNKRFCPLCFQQTVVLREEDKDAREGFNFWIGCSDPECDYNPPWYMGEDHAELFYNRQIKDLKALLKEASRHPLGFNKWLKSKGIE